MYFGRTYLYQFPGSKLTGCIVHMRSSDLTPDARGEIRAPPKLALPETESCVQFHQLLLTKSQPLCVCRLHLGIQQWEVPLKPQFIVKRSPGCPGSIDGFFHIQRVLSLVTYRQVVFSATFSGSWTRAVRNMWAMLYLAFAADDSLPNPIPLKMVW